MEFIHNNIVGILVFLGVFFEISPIKINPISWLGKKLNKSINDKLDKLEKKVDLNDAYAIRSRVLDLYRRMRLNEDIDKDQYKTTFKDIDKYYEYKKDYPCLDGELENARKYIYKYYNEVKKDV